MKYLKKFETHPEYTEFIETDEFIKPNVSCCTNETVLSKERDVHYNPIYYSEKYLTFVAKADGTFKFSGSITTNTLSYSLDNGDTWTSLPDNTNTPIVSSGSKILWKGTCSPQTNTGIGSFTSTAQFDIEGNIMSLVSGDNFTETTTVIDYSFLGLFRGNTNIINAENLSLPATTLASFCYTHLFRGCTSLITPPQLPATTLAANCYQSMFQDCTSLTTVPKLPVTTLTDGCYAYMFTGCTNLTTAPQLPATTLANGCYQGMFNRCTSLTTAPELPVTILAANCYQSMFSNCTNLTTAPQLPATTLFDSCYRDMFTSCTSLTNAPKLPATTLTDYCYYQMFRGCNNLNSIICLATDISASNCTSSWVMGVASTGTFTKAASMTWITSSNGIPNGWTVKNASA